MFDSNAFLLAKIDEFTLIGIEGGNCVLQWRYVAGNNWGICPDGKGALGCGPQEEFRACSDITIGNDTFDIFKFKNRNL